MQKKIHLTEKVRAQLVNDDENWIEGVVIDRLYWCSGSEFLYLILFNQCNKKRYLCYGDNAEVIDTT